MLILNSFNLDTIFITIIVLAVLLIIVLLLLIMNMKKMHRRDREAVERLKGK